ncbi:MAG TPA: O-antigen ligase family protein [Candidatus Brocadiia bacterium]|nr:O-antigen ligase family protein [Candidatus Brocadiia bacterium]
MLVCLFLTKSKGGWIAFAAAMTFFALRSEEWLRRRLGKPALMALAGLAVVAIIAQEARLTPPLADYKGSLEGRVGYWRGALQIVVQRPLFGVGGGNFPEAYSAVKRASDEETKFVHNDYLQIAVEMGVFGLLGYLALWWRFWRVVGRRGPDPPPGEDGGGDWWVWPLGLGFVVFGLALVFGFAPGSEKSWWRQGWPLALTLTWVSLALLNLRPAARVSLSPRSFAVAGIQAGLAGFLIHGLADFDLFVHGLAETVAVLAGLCVAVATAGREDEARPRRLSSTGRLALAAAGLAAMLGFWWGMGERLVMASALQDDATNVTLDLSDLDRIKKLEAAARLDPLDDTTQARLADLYWFRRGDMTKALGCAEEAARLSPARSEHYARLARLHLESYMRTRLPKALQLAYGNMRRAVGLFPSFPALWVELALISQMEGRPSEALDYLREALWLNRDQYHHVRRKLAPEMEAAARERMETLERELRAHSREAGEIRPRNGARPR